MNVKIARIKKGLTQIQFRNLLRDKYKIGLSPNTLVRIEKGIYDNLKFSTMKIISDALDSTFEELFLK